MITAKLLRSSILILVPCLLAILCTCGGDRTPRLQVPLPFGAVDSIGVPQPDGTISITGWALSDDPIQAIALYIDGRYVTSARMFQSRPEINKAYPAYGAANAGWRIELDRGLFPGEHELVIQAHTMHGAVRDLHQARILLSH